MKENNDKIRMRIKEEEKNIFKDDVVRRHKMEWRNKTLERMAILMVEVFFIVIVLPNRLTANTTDVSLAWVLEIIKNRTGSLISNLGNGKYCQPL